MVVFAGVRSAEDADAQHHEAHVQTLMEVPIYIYMYIYIQRRVPEAVAKTDMGSCNGNASFWSVVRSRLWRVCIGSILKFFVR